VVLSFGYDTYVFFFAQHSTLKPGFSGIAGGVVSQKYFQSHFGFLDETGKPITKKVNAITSNVVSVLQAGAFFGALGSAPISGQLLNTSYTPAKLTGNFPQPKLGVNGP
jgi:hypothetical protein